MLCIISLPNETKLLSYVALVKMQANTRWGGPSAGQHVIGRYVVLIDVVFPEAAEQIKRASP